MERFRVELVPTSGSPNGRSYGTIVISPGRAALGRGSAARRVEIGGHGTSGRAQKFRFMTGPLFTNLLWTLYPSFICSSLLS